MLIDVAAANVVEVYQLLVGVVTPRPIAWVTTVSPAGVVNLAEASKTSAKPVKFGVHQVAAAPVQPGVFVRNSPFFDSGVSDLPEPAS